MSLRMMSFFILLLISNLGLASHSYYCKCHPPKGGACTCRAGNAVNPVTGAAVAGLGGWALTRMWVHCIAPHTTLEDPANYKLGPYVWRSSHKIHCGAWGVGGTNPIHPIHSFSDCTNSSLYSHKIAIKYITCYYNGP